MLRHNLTLVDMIRQGLGVLMVAINQGIITQQGGGGRESCDI